MKAVVCLFCILFSLVAFGAPADEEAIRSRIAALEKAWNIAYKLGDAKSLGELLDDTIVLINDDGSVQTKAEFLRTLKAASVSQNQQVSAESITVRLHGTTAVASGVFRAEGYGADGKHYIHRERFVDTWIYKSDKWLCVATSATPVLH
jgi:ketosteroid isomerase-like protein